MGAQLKKYKEETVTFRRKQNHDLKKLNKVLSELDEEIIAKYLLIVRTCKDEGKVLQALNKLADLRIQVSNILNTDEIQRLLLETKNPDRVRNLVPEDDDVPQINFTDIVDAD